MPKLLKSLQWRESAWSIIYFWHIRNVMLSKPIVCVFLWHNNKKAVVNIAFAFHCFGR